MDLKKSYVILDNTAVDTGVEVKDGDCTFVLSYYNSSKAQVFFHSEIEKLKFNGTDKTDAVIQAMRLTLVEKVVLGWKNITEDDVVVEYSKEECKRLLDTYAGLDVKLMALAMDVELFRRKQMEEIEGN